MGHFLHSAMLQGVLVGRDSPVTAESTFLVSLWLSLLITHASACVSISNFPNKKAGEILMGCYSQIRMHSLMVSHVTAEYHCAQASTFFQIHTYNRKQECTGFILKSTAVAHFIRYFKTLKSSI